MQQFLRHFNFNRSFLKYLPFLISSAILCYTYYPDFIAPKFYGDAGYRLDHADSILVQMINRIWLPALQIQIYLLHSFGAPVIIFKLLPLAYLFLFLLTFNRLSNRVIGSNFSGVLFATVFLISFTHITVIHFVGLSLHQEVLVLALFHVIAYLYYFARSSRLVPALLFVGVVTREYFWVYLYAYLLVTLTKWKGSPRPRLPVVVCAIIPAVWVYLTSQPGLLGTNKVDNVITYQSILARLTIYLNLITDNNLHYLLIALTLINLYALISEKHLLDRLFPRSLYRSYLAFSLFSIITIYSYLILFDPFLPPDNQRIIFPLLVHIPLLVIFSHKIALRLGMVKKIVFNAMLLISIVQLPNTRLLSTTNKPVNFEYYRIVSAFVEEYDFDTTGSKSDLICVAGLGYLEYLALLVAPLLYQQRLLLRENLNAASCRILIAPESYPGNKGLQVRSFLLANQGRFGIFVQDSKELQ